MAKKIDFNNIADSFNKFHSVNSIGDYTFSFSRSYSTDKIDNSSKIILEHFLPLIIIQTVFYYELESSTNKLDEKHKDFLNKYKEELVFEFKQEDYSSLSYQKYVKKLLKKMFLIDLTKDEYNKRKFTFLNDDSSKHENVFKNKSNKFPKKNFSLKPSGMDLEHYRIGIDLDRIDEGIIKIVNFTKRKTRNK